MSAAKRKSKPARGRAPASSGRSKTSGARAHRAAVERDAGSGASSSGSSGGLARLAVWGIALVPPLLVSPTAEDAFRLPKTLAAEGLALLSLLAIAIGWWRGRDSVSLAAFGRRPATLLAALIFAAILPGALFAVHPDHWRRATVSTIIALACLVLWSARLGEQTLRRALDVLVVAATALALLAVLQAENIFRPFAFAGQDSMRYQLTSLAGSAISRRSSCCPRSCSRPRCCARARWRVGSSLAFCSRSSPTPCS
jgi:hypothetical protein